MARFSEEKRKRLHALAEGVFLEHANPDITAFLRRMEAEGGDLFADVYSGFMTFYNAPRRTELSEIDVAVVGVPFESGAPVRGGTRLGPRAAREWSRVRGPIHDAWDIVPFELCSIADFGDIKLDSPHDTDSCVEAIAAQYAEFRKHGIAPLSIGGVHTMTHPILKGLAGGDPVGLVHIDAHADTARGTFQGQKNNDCAVFLNSVLDEAIDPDISIQIGIRGSLTPFWSFSEAAGMRVIRMSEVFEIGVEGVLKEIRAVIGDNPFYLTLDTDGLDATFLPGTQLPEPFGFTTREVLQIIRGLRGMDMIGADIVELCPPYDPHDISANIVGAFGFELLCILSEAHSKRHERGRKTTWSK